MAGNQYTVTAQTPGFRRAGRAWPAQPVEVSRADFSEAEWAALTAEPLLTVMPAGRRDTAAAPVPEPAPVPAGHVAIVARVAGFRRAGRSWPAGRTVLPADGLSPAQLAALRADPEIRVIEGEAPAPGGEDRDVLLDDAVTRLVAANSPDNYTKSGYPKTAALEVLSGLDDVAAAERDAAWDRHLAREPADL